MMSTILKNRSKLFVRKMGKYTQGYKIGPIDSKIIKNLTQNGIALHICKNSMQAIYYAARIRAIIYHNDPDLLPFIKSGSRGYIMAIWTLDKFFEKATTQEMIDKAYELKSFTQNDALPPNVCNDLNRRLNKIIDGNEEPVFESEDAIRKYIMEQEGEENE